MGPGYAFGLRTSPTVWLDRLLASTGEAGCTSKVPPISPGCDEEPPPLVPRDGAEAGGEADQEATEAGQVAVGQAGSQGAVEEGDTYPSTGGAAGEGPART